MKSNEMDDRGAELLIVGIVKQAVDDYVDAAVKLWRYETDITGTINTIIKEHKDKIPGYNSIMADEYRKYIIRQCESTMDVCRKFFRSGCNGLCDIPYERIMENVYKLIAKRKKNIRKNRGKLPKTQIL